jgi:hypothetical protein
LFEPPTGVTLVLFVEFVPTVELDYGFVVFVDGIVVLDCGSVEFD